MFFFGCYITPCFAVQIIHASAYLASATDYYWLCATGKRIYERSHGEYSRSGDCAAFLEKIWADYLNSVAVCSFSKSVSMTILRYIVMNLINLSTQYLSASNVISAFTVRTVY